MHTSNIFLYIGIHAQMEQILPSFLTEQFVTLRNVCFSGNNFILLAKKPVLVFLLYSRAPKTLKEFFEQAVRLRAFHKHKWTA